MLPLCMWSRGANGCCLQGCGLWCWWQRMSVCEQWSVPPLSLPHWHAHIYLPGTAHFWHAAHHSAFPPEKELSLPENTKMCYTGSSQCSLCVTLRCGTGGGLQELLAGQCWLKKSFYQWEGNRENSFCSRHVSGGEEGNITEVPTHAGAPWCHEPGWAQAPARPHPHAAVPSPGPCPQVGSTKVCLHRFYLRSKLSPFQPHCDSMSSWRLLTLDHLQCPEGKYNDSLLLVNEASKH